MSNEKLGKGTLSHNKYKKSDTHPDSKGKILIQKTLEPGEYELSAWNKEGPYGHFQSITLQPKYQKQDNGGEQGNPSVPF